jgi:hypothetical protein
LLSKAFKNLAGTNTLAYFIPPSARKNDVLCRRRRHLVVWQEVVELLLLSED